MPGAIDVTARAGSGMGSGMASGNPVLAAERIRRIRWRSRRGLLENDIVLTRFLDANERLLTNEQALALDQLADLPDPDLLDLILCRTEPSGTLDCPPVHRLLAQLRMA